MDDPDIDQQIEKLAEVYAMKWAALMTRLEERGFSRHEATSLLRMYVLSSSLDVNVSHEECDLG